MSNDYTYGEASEVAERLMCEYVVLAEGGVSHKDLGKEYGVHVSNIGLIIKRKTWTHV